MDKIYIGKITSTHGIKGEIRIRSDFEYKDKVFKINNKLIIDNKEYTIKTYRHHKIFEMVTLNDYNNINDILFLIGKKVYFNKSDLFLEEEEVLDEDLLNYKVIVRELTGKIEEIFYASKTNKIIRININNKSILVPYNSPMIKKIDKKNHTIYIELIEGMI